MTADGTRRAQIAARLEKFKADRLDSLPADVAITYLLAELALADAEVGRLTQELADAKAEIRHFSR